MGWRRRERSEVDGWEEVVGLVVDGLYLYALWIRGATGGTTRGGRDRDASTRRLPFVFFRLVSLWYRGKRYYFRWNWYCADGAEKRGEREEDEEALDQG